MTLLLNLQTYFLEYVASLASQLCLLCNHGSACMEYIYWLIVFDDAVLTALSGMTKSSWWWWSVPHERWDFHTNQRSWHNYMKTILTLITYKQIRSIGQWAFWKAQSEYCEFQHETLMISRLSGTLSNKRVQTKALSVHDHDKFVSWKRSVQAVLMNISVQYQMSPWYMKLTYDSGLMSLSHKYLEHYRHKSIWLHARQESMIRDQSESCSPFPALVRTSSNLPQASCVYSLCHANLRRAAWSWQVSAAFPYTPKSMAFW